MSSIVFNGSRVYLLKLKNLCIHIYIYITWMIVTQFALKISDGLLISSLYRSIHYAVLLSENDIDTLE